MTEVQTQPGANIPSPRHADGPRDIRSGVKRQRSPSPGPSHARRRTSPPPPRSRSRSLNRNNGLRDQRGREIPQARNGAMDGTKGPRRERAAETKPLSDSDKQALAKAEYERLLNVRSGGTYIPPARLRALQAEITDKTSKEYQRMAWEALKKSINGLVNKVNVSNIKYIVPELFGENLIRGRGLFCRSVMKAQAASLPFTPIYATMVAIVNTKLPQVGELLVGRLITQFRKAFKRNDKAVCLSATTFIAHLVNQQVVHEMLAAQILLLLLHKPTDDSVEIAVGFTKEVGQHLEEMNGPIAVAVFDQFRSILHEADIDKRVQYMIEVLFQVRKDKYKDHPAVKEELDLVEEEDQITHRPGLDEVVDVLDELNVFKLDPDWQEHEDAYQKLKAEILGEGGGSGDDDEEDGSDESSDDEEGERDKQLQIKDQTNTDLVNLRRTIYLTIKSSGGFEECCHRLMKINLPVGQEAELISMIVECASQERTYDKFYGLIGERFCRISRLWMELFESAFAKYYDTIHRYETNPLRIIAQLFGHLLTTDAIGWHVLSVIRLNEDETTSSSRIFIKILFEDLSQGMGIKNLQNKLSDDMLRSSLEGIFPKDDTRNTRFSINFFTAIGMGGLTEDMREYLKALPKPVPAALPLPESDSDSASNSSRSSYTSRSFSRSRSRSLSRGRLDRRRGYQPRSRSRSRSRTPMRRSRSMSQGKDHKYRRRAYSSSPERERRRVPARRSRSPMSSRSRGYDDAGADKGRYDRYRKQSPERAPAQVPIRRRPSPSVNPMRKATRSPHGGDGYTRRKDGGRATASDFL